MFPWFGFIALILSFLCFADRHWEHAEDTYKLLQIYNYITVLALCGVVIMFVVFEIPPHEVILADIRTAMYFTSIVIGIANI